MYVVLNYNLELFDQAQIDKDSSILTDRELDSIALKLKRQAFGMSKVKVKRLYVQEHQSALISFKKDPICGQCADKLLYFLETTFPKHLDPELPISDLGKDKLFDELKVLIATAKEELSQNVSTPLYQLIKPLLEPTARKISVHEARYVQSFWNKWKEEQTSPAYSEEILIAFLCKMCFNAPQFSNYLISKIIKQVFSEDTSKAQSEVLDIFRNKYCTFYCENNIAFCSNTPCIGKQMHEWIEGELKVRYKRMKHSDENQLSIPFKEKSKLKTSLSVAELACFFRLLKQNGIIVNKTEKDICTAISQMFSTERMDDISLVSIHNRYYAEDSPAREKVKKIFLKMAHPDS